MAKTTPGQLKSGQRGLLSWPPFVAGGEVFLQRLLYGLASSEKWPGDDFHRGQPRQLASLLSWSTEQAPHYRELGLRARKLISLTDDSERFWESWRELPLLTKTTLRSQATKINARSIPEAHKPLDVTRTSGSTGIPVEVRTTRITRCIWEALTVREHLWQQRDFSKRLGIIRYRSKADRGPHGTDLPSWGPPVASLYPTGPASVIHVGLDVDVLLQWLHRFDPHYLLTYPSVGRALLDACAARGGKPTALEEIRFMSEPLDRELEERLQAEWRVRVTDMYSANEVGHIAFRCREHGKLHVQSEALLVEILDDKGMPCAPGQTGRVVITSLHNLATPLVRYEIGDYATVGSPCPCGRSLPVINRVHGRVRNLLHTPDGRTAWPVGLGVIRVVSSVQQAQWVQIELGKIQLRVVVERPLTEAERQTLVDRARLALGYPFEIEIAPVAEIARGPTGKYEEFVSLVSG